MSETQTVMIVDDTAENLRLLSEMLSGTGYRVRAFSGGATALQAARRDPPDLILLDIGMPGMDGYQVCEALKQDDDLRGVPVLFLSALRDINAKIRAFSTGGLDYIEKPFRFEEVEARVKTHLQLRQLQLQLEEHNERLELRVAEQVREISDAQVATIEALAKLAESRDDDTGQHVERVRTYSMVLADSIRSRGSKANLNEGFVNTIYRASPLHDIGKVAIPDAVLRKPGRLTTAEFDLIKTHTVIGAQTLEVVQEQYPNNAYIRMALDIVRSHHEKWDGSGYPDGLRGEAIPLPARIVALADVYDALRSKRPYKDPWTPERTVNTIVDDSGSHFDPNVVEVFLAVADDFGAIHDRLADKA